MTFFIHPNGVEDNRINNCSYEDPPVHSMTYLGTIIEGIPDDLILGAECGRLDPYCNETLSDNFCVSAKFSSSGANTSFSPQSKCEINAINKAIKQCEDDNNSTIVKKEYEVNYTLYRSERICIEKPEYPDTSCYVDLVFLYDSCWVKTSKDPGEPYKKASEPDTTSCKLDPIEGCKCPYCATCEDYEACECNYWKYATNPFLASIFPNDCGTNIDICPYIDPEEFKPITLDDAGTCKDIQYNIISSDYCCSSEFQKSLEADCRESIKKETETIDTLKCTKEPPSEPCIVKTKLPTLKTEKCKSIYKYCKTKASWKKGDECYYKYEKHLQDKVYSIICDSCDQKTMDECLAQEGAKCPSGTDRELFQLKKYLEPAETIDEITVKYTAYFCIKN